MSEKEKQEVPKKPTNEVKRLHQNDQEKQRKEKIKACIGEIAKELPPQAEQLDRKPSTLYIVLQTKEYIQKLKKQIRGYEQNLVADQQQEELRQLREAHNSDLERIRKLEEMLKNTAVEKVTKMSNNDLPSTTGHHSDGSSGRRRPKTINKLFVEKNEMLQQQSNAENQDNSHPLNPSSLTPYNHSNTGTLPPPPSLLISQPSSTISIMTVAPTILSVKSPSLGQSRNQQMGGSGGNRLTSTSSSASSMASGRVNNQTEVGSYLDMTDNNYGNDLTSTTTNADGSLSAISHASSSSQPSSLSSSSSTTDPQALIGLPTMLSNNNTSANNNSINMTHSNNGNNNHANSLICGGNSGDNNNLIIGNHLTSDLGNIHSASGSVLNLGNQHEVVGPNSALQTLASVATSTHMASVAHCGGQTLCNPMAMNVISGSLSQQQQQQLHHHQPPIMSISQQSSDGCATVGNNLKQVIVNGQLLTVSDSSPNTGHLDGGDCGNMLSMSNLCPPHPPTINTLNLNPQPSNLNQGHMFNPGSHQQMFNMSGGQNTLNTGPNTLGHTNNNSNNNTIIYTFSEHGQLVAVQNSINPVSSSSGGLDMISNLQNSGIMQSSSIQHSAQPNPTQQFISGPGSVVSMSGSLNQHHSSAPHAQILLPPSANPLHQVLPQGPFLFPQQQQQQILNLGGLGGVQILNPFTAMMNNLGPLPAQPQAPPINNTVKLIGNDVKLVPPGDHSLLQGPTHVMVDGSLIPISTNPQTIVPNGSPLAATVTPKASQIPVGNPILQFDPNNPSAPPILLNAATGLQMGPGPAQLMGSPLQSATPAGLQGIIQVAPGASIGGGGGAGSASIQLGGANGGMMVVSSIVANTVTTNSVATCISSVGAVTNTSTKVVKALPSLAPSLAIGPTPSTVTSAGSQITSATTQQQQLVINGQKVVATRITASSSTPKSNNRRRSSPSAARASPVVAAEVPPQLILQQQHHHQQISSNSATIPILSALKTSTPEKPARSRSLSTSRQDENTKRKTDLLAQATATAGILMDSNELGQTPSTTGTNNNNNNNNNNSSNNNQSLDSSVMNISGSSTELQINLKSSPCDDEEDNIQLIIDENCAGVSSTSPAQSAFSPNMTAGLSVKVSPSSSGLKTVEKPGLISPTQPLRMQMPGIELITPIVSPNIPTVVSSTEQRKEQHQLLVNAISSINSISNNLQLLSPLPSSIFSSSSTASSASSTASSSSSSSSITSSSSSLLLNQSLPSTVQVVGGPFRPEDVFAQLARNLPGDPKTTLDIGKRNTSCNGPSSINANKSLLSPSLSSISTPTEQQQQLPTSSVKSYVPIAPAPTCLDSVTSNVQFMKEQHATLSFTESAPPHLAHATNNKPPPKPKGSRTKKGNNTVLTNNLSSGPGVPPNMDANGGTGLLPAQDQKKKPAPKKRKTRAELKQEKEEMERARKEGEENEKRAMEAKAVQAKVLKKVPEVMSKAEEDSLLAVLEASENEDVKEQILNSVSESKLLNTDGNLISLMDVVDNMETFASQVEGDVFSETIPEQSKDKACKNNGVLINNINKSSMESHNKLIPDAVTTAAAVIGNEAAVSSVAPGRDRTTRKRKEASTVASSNAKNENNNKRFRKPAQKQVENVPDLSIFATSEIHTNDATINNNPSSVVSASASSDIYDFVDDDDTTFIQPPPTPSRSPTKKATVRKGRGKANAGDGNASDSKSSGVGVTTRSDARNNTTGAKVGTSSDLDNGNNMNNVNTTHLSVSSQPLMPSSTSSPSSFSMPRNMNLSTPVSVSTSVSAVSAFSASLEMISPPLPVQISSTPLSTSSLSLSSSSSFSPSALTTVSATTSLAPTQMSVPSSAPLLVNPMTLPSSVPASVSGLTLNVSHASTMSSNLPNHQTNNRKQPPSTDNTESLGPSLEESFSMDFPVMDFQSSPKLESHDDSMSAEAIADFFNQESPGKINFHSSPPNLNNNVLSPSDVDLPALRTPAPPDTSNVSESSMMMSQSNREDKGNGINNSSSSSAMQIPSRMHTPTPERKSPVSSLVDNISTSAPPVLAMPSSGPSVVPPPLRSCQSTGNGNPKQNTMAGFSLGQSQSLSMPVMDSSSSADGQIPSLSSSSLDALPEIIPLKPITSEIQAEAEANTDCSQQMRASNQQPPQMPPHVPSMVIGGHQPQQQQQHQQHQLQLQHNNPPPMQPQPMPDVQQQQNLVEQQQRHNQPQPPHFTPQSSPHNLRPPSASSITPLPSPKLHASPGSASNPGSVHGMSPAAQQHPCHQQIPSPMDRSSVPPPPLSHPPQPSQTPNSSLIQMFPPPQDSSSRNAGFGSPPTGNIKLKHMSPAHVPEQQQSQVPFKSYPNGPSPSQQQKNQYSVEKIMDHPANSNTSTATGPPRIPSNENLNYGNMGSAMPTTSPVPSSTNVSSNNPGGAFPMASSAPCHPSQSSCSANGKTTGTAGSSGNNNTSVSGPVNNVNTNNSNASQNNSRGGSMSSLQPPAIPPSAPHSSPYASPFFPLSAPPMPIPSSSATSTSSHHLGMHPVGNMEIQHTSPAAHPPSNPTASTTPDFHLGVSSLMTFNNQPKLNIPPIARSPSYISGTTNPSNATNAPVPNNSNSNTTNNTNRNMPNTSSNNTHSSTSGKSPSAGSSYPTTANKNTMDNTTNNRYPSNNNNNNKHSAESIYQQQQKRPNTIQHPPTPASHMDPMSRLPSSASSSHPNFFPMGFPPPPASSSSSMPLRHLPDARDVPSRSPYDYPPVPPHPSMGFPPHPHSGYGPHSHFTRDCSHLPPQQPPPQQQQPPPQQHQQQQQAQAQQPSPRKQNTPKKSSSNSSVSSNNTSSSGGSNTHRSSSCSNSGTNSSGNNSSNLGPPSRSAPSHHHSSHHTSSTSSSSTSSSNNSSSQNRSNAQKRKAASSSSSSSSSSSRKKNTASQHTGFPGEMDPGMGQSMFDSSFPYLNFPTLAQSMSPPAARPHQADTPFLGSMFNTPTRPISNASSKTADMTTTFPLFHTRAQNSFLQPGGFGMNSMTGNHGNTTGISPHSMAAVGSHMNPFGLFGNDGGAGDNIAAASNKFLHPNPILPGGAHHQGMDHSLQPGHHQTSALYHNRPHSAQPHMMPAMAFYPHGFDSRSHMGQFNGSMGHHPFPTHGLPPINFSMHESH